MAYAAQQQVLAPSPLLRPSMSRWTCTGALRLALLLALFRQADASAYPACNDSLTAAGA
jgi:hypothetical protein